MGFRNVLVHEYVDVDDGVVLRRLSDLADLREFVRAVTGWLP
ncbi:MAG: HepT-like ribonuclease domain-containing protein [Actinomycetota bacterium]